MTKYWSIMPDVFYVYSNIKQNDLVEFSLDS